MHRASPTRRSAAGTRRTDGRRAAAGAARRPRRRSRPATTGYAGSVAATDDLAAADVRRRSRATCVSVPRRPDRLDRRPATARSSPGQGRRRRGRRARRAPGARASTAPTPAATSGDAPVGRVRCAGTPTPAATTSSPATSTTACPGPAVPPTAAAAAHADREPPDPRQRPCAAHGPTVTSARIFSSVAGPTTFRVPRSSIDANGCSSRAAMIFAAVAGPMPGSVSSCLGGRSVEVDEPHAGAAAPDCPRRRPRPRRAASPRAGTRISSPSRTGRREVELAGPPARRRPAAP